MSNEKTWIILGASSAISRAFAHEVAKVGNHIVLAGRDLEDLEITASDVCLRHHVTVQAVYFDINDLESHKNFVEKCEQFSTGEHNLFFAIGTMPSQAGYENNINLIQSTITTNFLSAASILSQFTPMFERQGSGKMIILGSVAGDRGRPKNYIYGSAKSGLHTFVQGLRAKLFKHGVTVTTIKPGFIDTSMTFGLPNLFLVASPTSCAASALKATMKNKDIHYFPWFWRWIMLIITLIPEKIFKKLNI